MVTRQRVSLSFRSCKEQESEIQGSPTASRRRLSSEPGGIALTDGSSTGTSCHRAVGLIRIREFESFGASEFVSLANQAATRFRIFRSSRCRLDLLLKLFEGASVADGGQSSSVRVQVTTAVWSLPRGEWCPPKRVNSMRRERGGWRDWRCLRNSLRENRL